MDVTVHFQPLADQVYVYTDGHIYANREPHITTMDITYSHHGRRCFISCIKGKFNRDVWKELVHTLAERGVELAEYEHKGKNVSEDLTRQSGYFRR